MITKKLDRVGKGTSNCFTYLLHTELENLVYFSLLHVHIGIREDLDVHGSHAHGWAIWCPKHRPPLNLGG